MIAIGNDPLPNQCQQALSSYQKAVDDSGTYPQQVITAAKNFSQYNKATNPTFAEVRAALDRLCSGARRCMYCEDSQADEVEHHSPKNLYPSLAFVWENLLYACGPCNGPKKNRFAIRKNDGSAVDVTRARNSPIVAPEQGTPMLLSPRFENPLDFIFLDIVGGTFIFSPHPTASSEDQERARYTIDLLGLNRKDILARARKSAFHSYVALIQAYGTAKSQNEHTDRLVELQNAILRSHHPTVLREMIRQRERIQSVRSVVLQSPEILDWLS